MEKRDTILIVDDMEVNRAILCSVFEQDYNLLEAENGEQALVLLEQYHGNMAAVLLDLVMPVMDGYQVMKELGTRGLLAEFPVIVITAENSVKSELQTFDLGASDIIAKPFEPHVVKRRVQNVVELNLRRLNQEELIEEQAQKLRESNAVMVDALSSIIEYRSVETGQHIQRIRMFTKVLLEDVARSCAEFGLDDRSIGVIVSASSMHDIGKIAIPDSILNKPGRLTAEEFEVMKTHTTKGCEMLANLDRMSERDYLHYAYNICRYHHERWDGRGYPDGLRGDSIPICAQVVGVADCYDALTTDRVYKKAIPPEQAFNMILNGECGAFSPKLLECFKNVRDEFAQLSQEYADRRRRGAALPLKPPEPAPRAADALDTLQMGQLKYFTLLRYTDSTVMEVDLSTGLYHVVYLSSGDFEALKSGNRFEESFRNFVAEAVHPDDRALAMSLLGPSMEEFFEEGWMERTREYRVYHRVSGTYHNCRVTVLRVDTGNPTQRRIMLVWKDQGKVEQWEDPFHDRLYNGEVLGSLLGGILISRNDRWFTITQMSDSLPSMLGYTKREIAEKFQNRYVNLIHPDDWDAVTRQIRQQLQSGNFMELEYRLLAKDGQALWVLDKCRLIKNADGEEAMVCVIIDVTQSKKAQEELRLSLERHKIIMERANDIIFEWDIAEDQVTYSQNWKTKFGYEPIVEQASRQIPKASHVHPDDLSKFTKLVQDMKNGVPYAEIEFRLADAQGRYRWCKIRAAAQYNDQNKAFKAVGVLTDIDADRRASQALKDRAERDGLTRIYNKSAGRNQVEECLKRQEPGETSVLMILDVDNFKFINDNYGHMFGDVVLQEIASELRRLFRSQDVIARVGGDEFLIFMYGAITEEMVEARAARVIESLQGLLQKNVTQVAVSCSIGVAFCPRDGQDFDTLYQHSDLALYEAKAQGKNRYVLFDRATMDRPFGTPQSGQVAANTRIESTETPDAVLGGLVEQAFQELYGSGDVEQAVASILERIGVQFDVSRAYIFEDSLDGTQVRNTFEWMRPETGPQAAPQREYDYESLGGREAYISLFQEDNVFYCSDVSQLSHRHRSLMEGQGVRSMLQCAIRDGGQFRGFVGFDDFRGPRMWTQDQIDALIFMAKLLSVFLLKKRAQDRAEETVRDLRHVLDGQQSWVYVVDPGTHRIQYINAKAHVLAPDAREGMRCYEAFFQRNSPCENCPVGADGRYAQEAVEFYNANLGVWAMVNAAPIRWGGAECFLLCCQDITAYKGRREKSGGKTQP